MNEAIHHVDSTLVAIAGACFVVGYLAGLLAGARLGKVTLWPSIIIGLLCCLVRADAAPLGVAAIASVSLLHVSIGCLTVLILKQTKPLSTGSSS